MANYSRTYAENPVTKMVTLHIGEVVRASCPRDVLRKFCNQVLLLRATITSQDCTSQGKPGGR